MIEVVAAAVIRDGKVLAAHRVQPSGWEFPGGKVESDEEPEAALAREVREELSLDIEVGRRLGETDDGQLRLVLFRARADGDPAAGSDHDELRWLGAAELGDVDWLALDRVLLPSVLEQLD